MTYRLDHDKGYAPNPFHNYLTLAHCKPNFRKASKQIRGAKCIVPGKSLVIATAGKDLLLEDFQYNKGKLEKLPKDTPKLCRLVYAAFVLERMTYEDYYNDSRFENKKISQSSEIGKHGDNMVKQNLPGKIVNDVLIFSPFFYFGCFAPLLPKALWSNNAIKGYGSTSGSGCKYISQPEKNILMIREFLENVAGECGGIFGFPSFNIRKKYRKEAANIQYLTEIYQDYLSRNLTKLELEKVKPKYNDSLSRIQ